MACQVPPISQLTNNQQFITTAELAQSAAADIAYQLGIALTVGDTIIPLAPFIWAALAIEEILGLFGGGRPVDQDTNNVIWAYNMSAYWPLHALASDLAIALKNGAPISDSRPAIQAQFSAWKQGTITSIQQLAGLTPGPASPGYWQLQQLINTSWAYSAGGQQSVLQVVKAIDCFTEVLSQIAQQQKPQPSPAPTPTPGTTPTPTPSSGPCVSGDPNSDEILDLCAALNSELGAIQTAIQNLAAGQGSDPSCCTNVVAAIAGITQQLTIIVTALLHPPNGGTAIDLSGIVSALGELVAAVGAIAAQPPPDLTALVAAVDNVAAAIANPSDAAAAQLKRLADSNDAESALGKALVAQWSAQIPGDPGTVQLILA